MKVREVVGLILLLPVLVIFWCFFGIELLFYPYFYLISWINNGHGLSFKRWVRMVKEFPDG